jgi:hypothetical protein
MVVIVNIVVVVVSVTVMLGIVVLRTVVLGPLLGHRCAPLVLEMERVERRCSRSLLQLFVIAIGREKGRYDRPG